RQVDARGSPDGRAEAEPLHVGDMQWPRAPLLGPAGGTGDDDVAERVRARIAEIGRIRCAAAADRIQHQQHRARHQAMRSLISGAGAGAVSAIRQAARSWAAARSKPAPSAAWIRASGAPGSTEVPIPARPSKPTAWS